MNFDEIQDSRLQSIQDQLDKLKVCACEVKKIRYRLAKNDSKMFTLQCVRCGEYGTGEWIPHSEIENPDKIEPIDDYLKENYAITVRELNSALLDRQKEIGENEFKTTYKDYLQSPEWRAKRKKVLERAGGICEGCMESQANTVHHLTYQNCGNEFLFELAALCEYCHDRYHNRVT